MPTGTPIYRDARIDLGFYAEDTVKEVTSELEMAGWRRSIVGDDLVRLVEGELTLRVADGKIIVQATDAGHAKG